MAKAKSRKAFVCNDCGSESSKWQGQCPDCKAWNTMSEINLGSNAPHLASTAPRSGFAGALSDVQLLADVDVSQTPRFSSGIEEFDRVLGGGFVPGSAVLLGGHPGAGKSTVLLQVLCHIAQSMPALYVSGEESLQQIASRAQRLGLPTHQLKMLAETSSENVVAVAEREKPGIIVIDSIQVMFMAGIDSAPGGVSQVRESAAFLTRFAKQTNTVLLIVGHVTKDNSLAGPMTLSHIIDTQLMLGNSDDSRYRIMRATKNRFGQVNELGIFAMTERGLKEVRNPSAIFLNRHQKNTPGSIINVLWEGTRPLLVELQALVVESQLGNPRRVTVGLDQNRLAMLLAVLNRHGGIFTSDQDVFVNVVGGVRVTETSADLATVLAIVSSLRDRAISQQLFAFGEVGLSGEIRPVANGQERIQEAAKHGFKQAIVPKANLPRESIAGIELVGVTSLAEALDQIQEWS
ncbi:DNA repair protein RadA [Aestuariirhabdus sp. Z084]|uniref:DNA repair protein RadA n=1 Tax=Aestuariirhabdus haliotis TaxID=2918751 RepID=UPI00201B38D8|nr:DNA repair protein RadA [Aestuariirhabdus haliotis]MCL6415069.1 DNA repair protein RadA [Aestuariirhabdus haliotis]MCL6419001.1 DNA repair protein RadA [Aestuariirhabdus haliotis]